jgi:outer membrane protein TolC
MKSRGFTYGAFTKSIFLTAVLSVGLAGSQPGDLLSPDISNSSSLSDYLETALENNPGLKAAFYNWKSALEAIPQVKALPDPNFNYTYYIQEVETRVGPQKHKIGLSQMFPWFGKLRLKGGIAWEKAEAARQNYESWKLKLFYEVKDAYYDYYFLGRAMQIAEDNMELLKQWEKVARIRNASASIKHHNIIMIQVELGKIEDQLKTLESKISPMNQRLKFLLNVTTPDILPIPQDVEEESLTVTEMELWKTLIDNNPDLKALDNKIALTNKKIALAKKNYFPNFMLGLTYIQTDESAMPNVMENGKDPLLVMGSVNLPVHFLKNRAAVRQARLREQESKNMKANMENRLRFKLSKVVFDCNDAQRKINLYKHTLIPKGEQALGTVETAFKSSKAGFIDLVDAQRTLLKFELSYEKALVSRAQKIAELEMITGKELNNN